MYIAITNVTNESYYPSRVRCMYEAMIPRSGVVPAKDWYLNGLESGTGRL